MRVSSVKVRVAAPAAWASFAKSRLPRAPAAATAPDMPSRTALRDNRAATTSWNSGDAERAALRMRSSVMRLLLLDEAERRRRIPTAAAPPCAGEARDGALTASDGAMKLL